MFRFSECVCDGISEERAIKVQALRGQNMVTDVALNIGRRQGRKKSEGKSTGKKCEKRTCSECSCLKRNCSNSFVSKKKFVSHF